MISFARLTLKNKIFLSCLGLTFIVSVLIALLTRALLITSLTGELERRGVGIAQGVADSSRGFILTRKLPELTALAYDARLGNRKDVVTYALVTDAQGKILAHTFTTGFPKGFKPAEMTGSDSESRTEQRQVGRQTVFHISVPVSEGIYTIGSVQIGLDRAHIDNLVARLRLEDRQRRPGPGLIELEQHLTLFNR